MNDFIRLLNGGDTVPGSRTDLGWSWVTALLVAAVAAGYVVIAFDHYCQSRIAAAEESTASFARLRNIVLCSAVCGGVFFAADMVWLAWRLYDLVLFGLAWHTWSFALRIRGLALLQDRLVRAGQWERLARKYREIAELAPQIVWTASAEGGVDFSNQRWAEFAGDDRTWLEAVHPDERADVLLWWVATVATRSPAHREVRLGGAGGEYRTFVVKAAPVLHEGRVRWLGACADVEDQKRAVEQKESQGKRKMFFLNALSHDLRAPLNNVALNAHLLQTSARDEAEAESAKAIVENAVAAGDLVGRLLDYARLDGQEDNVLDRVPLADALRHLARRFVPVAAAKGLTLRVVAEADVELRTDRQKFVRVVSNLLDNAIKFTKSGGVTAELVARHDGGACVRVSDTGIGIPREHVPQLFDEFYQVGNPDRDRDKGFGMGLAICRTLARQIDGDVRLADTSTEGTTFEFTLPDLTRHPSATPVDPARAGAGHEEASVCIG